MVDFPEAFPDVFDHKFILLSEFLIDGESTLDFFDFLALILLLDFFVVLGRLLDWCKERLLFGLVYFPDVFARDVMIEYSIPLVLSEQQLWFFFELPDGWDHSGAGVCDSAGSKRGVIPAVGVPARHSIKLISFKLINHLIQVHVDFLFHNQLAIGGLNKRLKYQSSLFDCNGSLW